MNNQAELIVDGADGGLPADAATTTTHTQPPTGSMHGGLNILLKLVFLTCVALQVVLWPSVMTITFASILALEALVTLSTHDWKGLVQTPTSFSVLFLHGHRMTLTKYVYCLLMAAYMLIFFILFASHEARLMPAQTTWLHPSALHQYSFGDSANTPFEGEAGEVRGAPSKYMRNNPFVWPRALQRPAIAVNVTLPGVGPEGRDLACVGGGAFGCYSARLAAFDPPSLLPALHRYVPFPSQFYTADVIVTPAKGTACAALEVYRINTDSRKNVEHALDYPASGSSGVLATTTTTTTASDTTTTGALNRRCRLFGIDTWCLQFQYPFTSTEYTAKLKIKCAESSTTANGQPQQQLVIRLPPRGLDVQPATGLMGNDLLLVTAGATVEMRWGWHDLGVPPPLLGAWQQNGDTVHDDAQEWRTSSDRSSVFFKFAIAVIPLLILWYFLTVTFQILVPDAQVLMTCLAVLLPSAFVFLTVGAWLPMAGCIVCVIAISHTPHRNYGEGSDGGGAPPCSWWGPNVRHTLLFLTAVCNSVQFVWVLVLVQEAEWSAFLYGHTLEQLADTSSQFILDPTASPTWIGLLCPVALTINLLFLVGCAICVALELLSHGRKASMMRMMMPAANPSI
jgi:hypothetical protein